MSQLDRIERKLDSVLSQVGLVIEVPENVIKQKTYGVKIKEVSELIELWKNSRDPLKRKIGSEQAEYLCFLDPERVLQKDVYYQIKSNQSRLWRVSFSGIVVDDFYLMREKYYNRHTGEKVYKTPDWNKENQTDWIKPSKIFVKDENGRGIKIKNHCVLAYMNYSHPNNRYFQSKFKDNIVEAIEKKMEQDLNRLKENIKNIK